MLCTKLIFIFFLFFKVSNVNDDKTFCFFWHEGLGRRGANEIGTFQVFGRTFSQATRYGSNILFR